MFEIYMTRDNIEHLYIDEVDGGWVGNITFHNVSPGCPNSIGTPDAQPFPTRQQAFLAGARIVCDLFTGSRDLPFFACGDTLITVAYRT
jgi:hypothetical protein